MALELLNSRLEELDDISRDLSAGIRADSPGRRLLDETKRAMGISANWEIDPTLAAEPPSRETFEGAGVPVPPPAPDPMADPAAGLATPPAAEAKPPEAEPGGIVSKGIDVASRTGLMVARGAGEAITNTAGTIQDLRLLADDLLTHYVPPEAASPLAFHLGLPSSFGGGETGQGGDVVTKDLNSLLSHIVRAPETQYEETVRDISSVMIAMMPMMKGLQAMGMGARGASMAAGATAEAVAVDPNSPGFVDAIGMLSPGIQQEIKEFIKSTDPDDKAETDFHDRLRARGFRALTDGVMADTMWNMLGKVVKLAKNGHASKLAAPEVMQESAERLALPPGRATLPGGQGADASRLLPPSSKQMANEAMDTLFNIGGNVSPENLATVADRLATQHALPYEQTLDLINAGLDVMRESRFVLGSREADILGPRVVGAPTPRPPIAAESIEALNKLGAESTEEQVVEVAQAFSEKEGVPIEQSLKFVDTGMALLRSVTKEQASDAVKVLGIGGILAAIITGARSGKEAATPPVQTAPAPTEEGDGGEVTLPPAELPPAQAAGLSMPAETPAPPAPMLSQEPPTGIAEGLPGPAKTPTGGGFDASYRMVERNEGGFVADDVGAPAIYGINRRWFPKEHDEARRLTDEKGEAAGKAYAKQFYKKEFWDKFDLDNVPPDTQTAVMDAVVNHRADFAKELVERAKNGATRDEIIARRRDEYERLARSDKFKPYFRGWMQRLENLEQEPPVAEAGEESLGAQIAAAAGTTEEALQGQVQTAGIGSWVVDIVGKIVKGADDEAVEKLTLRKAERRIAHKKALVSEAPDSILREVTEQDKERAALFLADKPETVTINGTPHEINFEIIDTPAEFRKTLDQMSQLYEPEIEAARRMGTSRASETVLAHNMGMSVEQLRDFAQGTELLPKAIVAANEMLVASSKRLTGLRDAVMKGDANSEAAFLNQLVMHGEIQQSVGKIRSEVGRSLGMYNVKVDGTIELLRDAARGAKKMGKSTGVTIKELAKMHAELSPEQQAKFARDLTKPTTFGAIYEYWVNGILSGSAGVNAVGNVFTTMMAPIERLMAAGVPGSPVQAGEAKEMVYGYVGAIGDAFSLMSRTLRTEEVAFQGQKFAAPQAQITSELFGLKPDSAAGGAVNMFGKVWRGMGGGILRASDDAFKLINMRGELRARAYRAANEQGIQGAQREQFIQQFLNDPPDDALAAAIKARDVVTFSNELGDPTASFGAFRRIGGKIQEMTAKDPFLKIFFPFVRASVNVPTYAMERTPGLALMSRNFRANLMSADPELKAQTWAKVGTSGAMLGLAATLSHEGLITGPPPADAALAKKLSDEHGIQWNSIKIGNRWVELNRTDPLGWMLSSTAELANSVLGNDNIPEEAQRDLLSALVLSNAQMLSSKTYMYTVSQVVDAVRGGRFNQGDVKGMERILGTLAGSAVAPAIVNRMAQQIDPVKREYNTMMDSIKNRIPWMSKEQPPVVNSAGEEVLHTYGYGAGVLDPALTFVFPFATEKVKQPPGVEILRKHKLSLPLPGNDVSGVNINAEEADPKWVSRYRKLRSKEVKMGGKNLMDSIVAASELPVWQRLTDGPEGGKQILIDRLRRRYNEVAKRELMKEFPEIRQKAMQKKMDRVRGLMVPQ